LQLHSPGTSGKELIFATMDALKAAVLGDVITRSDIYCNSTPQEHQAKS
jgi:hypothetical protein